MLVKYTRPRETGGFHGTESKVEEIPDLDGNGEATAVPEGAKVVTAETPHDWQPDAK